MKISDLKHPVTAAKADWLPSTIWLGFTPTGKKSDAAEKCQSSINRQINSGYILERITDNFGTPNDEFETNERVLKDKDVHAKFADSLYAVHKLHVSSRPMVEIVGEEEFNELQNIWSSNGKRDRWSVAFPIVESYKIIDAPKARDVFSPSVFKKHFQYATSTLRPLNDEARQALENLEIEQINVPNFWIAVEDDIKAAEMTEIGSELQAMIDVDLQWALEGKAEIKKAGYRKRAAWLAKLFYSNRKRQGKIYCDDCGFKPETVSQLPLDKYRTCMDIHHKNPLAEGVRRTTLDDFALLCPTCHRIEHIRIDLKR